MWLLIGVLEKKTHNSLSHEDSRNMRREQQITDVWFWQYGASSF